MKRVKDLRVGIALAGLLLAGCALTPGFLTDDARLHQGNEHQAELVYVRPGVAWKGIQVRTPQPNTLRVAVAVTFEGEAAVEARITDAMTGQILAEAVDKRIGDRTLNANSVNSWGDVDSIMQFWTARAAYDLCRVQERPDCQMPGA